MAQVKSLGVAAATLVVVSITVLVFLSLILSRGVALDAVIVESLAIAALATPVLYFAVLRPQAAARLNAERKADDLAAALAAEIAAHRDTEQALSQRADEIEYNHSFIEDHAAEMVALAEQISAQKSDIEESKRRSDYTANHDLLTGLPNRRNFQNKLAEAVTQALDQGHQGGLIYIDLNNFKAVNDQLGHDHGDQLLQEVAERLRASLQPGHVAARLGGDEFAVIVATSAGIAEITDLAAALGQELKIDVETPKGVISVGASLGLALFPQNGSNSADILRRADQAMYAAKAQKGARFIAYSDIADAPRQATGS